MFRGGATGVGGEPAGNVHRDPQRRLLRVSIPLRALEPQSANWMPRFSCPLTPAENRLGVRIEAGERLAPEAD